MTVATAAALWVWPDGSRYLRQFSTPQARTDVLRCWQAGEGVAAFRVKASAGYRILGDADMAVPVDLIERRAA